MLTELHRLKLQKERSHFLERNGARQRAGPQLVIWIDLLTAHSTITGNAYRVFEVILHYQGSGIVLDPFNMVKVPICIEEWPLIHECFRECYEDVLKWARDPLLLTLLTRRLNELCSNGDLNSNIFFSENESLESALSLEHNSIGN